MNGIIRSGTSLRLVHPHPEYDLAVTFAMAFNKENAMSELQRRDFLTRTGAFAAAPATAAPGATVTLTASNVAETGGSIASVHFYRETNGTAGLQIGGDTLAAI